MAFLGGFKRPQPAPLGPEERRNPPWRNFPPAPPVNIYVYKPTPQPGAQAASFQSCLYQLGYNPIGAGRVPPSPFRPQGQMASSYQHGVIIFGQQMINYGRQPETGGPLWAPGQLLAMMGDYSQAAQLTPAQAAGVLPSAMTQALANSAARLAVAGASGWRLPPHLGG